MRREELLQLLFREVRIVDDAARISLLKALPPRLSEQQFAVLSHLRFTTNRDETPGDLARLFGVSRPAMTQLLARLVRRQLVMLQSSERDGRSRHVTLTNAGRAAQGAVLETLGTELAAIARKLRKPELEALLTDLKQFRIAVESALPRTAPHPDPAPDADRASAESAR